MPEASETVWCHDSHTCPPLSVLCSSMNNENEIKRGTSNTADVFLYKIKDAC